jgi:hypothetical protein
MRNTKWLKNGKFRKAILSAFYNISQRNFGILLILWCSFKLWWNFCLDQNFSYKGKGPLGEFQVNFHPSWSMLYNVTHHFGNFRATIRQLWLSDSTVLSVLEAKKLCLASIKPLLMFDSIALKETKFTKKLLLNRTSSNLFCLRKIFMLFMFNYLALVELAAVEYRWRTESILLGSTKQAQRANLSVIRSLRFICKANRLLLC